MSSHQSGRLKQSNKGHKKLGHSSKRGVERKLAKGGRIVGNTKKNKERRKFPSKDTEGAGRANRLNRARQIAAGRRKVMILKRRFGAGAGQGAPKVLCIVGLNSNADDLAYQTRTLILSTSDNSPWNAANAPGFASTMSSERYRQRFTILTPPSGDITAVLDAAKVCDILVVVVEASVDASNYTNNTGVDTLCCLRSQGLPNVVGVQLDLVTTIPQKQRASAKKLGLRFFETELGAGAKVIDVERSNASAAAALLSRVLSETTGKELTFRKNRSYMLADNCQFVPSTMDNGATIHNTTTKDLRVSGFIRGAPLNVNSLIHLTGVGTYRLRRIEYSNDPCPRKQHHRKLNNNGYIAVADVQVQDSLTQTAEPDQLMGEQSFISDAELREADERFNPETGGKVEEMSIHQEWIQAAKEAMVSKLMNGSSDDDMFDDLSEEDDGDDPVLGALDGRGNPIGLAATKLMNGGMNDGMGMDDDDDDDDDDKNKSAAQVREEALAMRRRRQEDDVKFPDEVDTPIDTPARIRFAKYRGLKSFRSSPWDPKESLPQNYSYIYQLNNFSLLQKVECTRMEMLSRELEKKQLNSIEQKKQKNKKGNQKKNNDDDEDVSMNTNSFSISEARQDTLKELDDSANPGTYVTLVLADVEEAVLSSYPAHSPLVLSTLMAHENKMSVMHFLVQKSTATCDDTIQSKDNLDICCGFRRTINSRPIFSQHNFNSDKHKYERFLMPGRFTCASAYYPITYGQPPTLIMKTLENGKKQLVASGSAIAADPDRIVLKKIVLTGLPTKCKKSGAIVKYMFFNAEDVQWFKPVELTTKYGLSGHTKQSVGLHGSMKCVFNAPTAQHDTVCMNLYKRVYPKHPLNSLTLGGGGGALTAQNLVQEK